MMLHQRPMGPDFVFYFESIRKAIGTKYPLFNFKDLKLGSDQESAIVLALDQVFPEATKLRCYLHLRDNLTEHWKGSNLTVDLKTQISSISQALMWSDSEEEYCGLVEDLFALPFPEKDERREDRVENNTCSIGRNKKKKGEKSEIGYITNHVNIIKKHICKPRWKFSMRSPYSNNNAESNNHVIKSFMGWVPCTTALELIDTLKRIVAMMFNDLQKSLYGQGNFKLGGAYTYHQWKNRTKEQQAREFKMLLDNSFRSIMSTDRSLKYDEKVQRTARKPGFRKRVRAERTPTMNHYPIKKNPVRIKTRKIGSNVGVYVAM